MNCPPEPTPRPIQARSGVFAEYKGIDGIHDESVGAEGLRPHWKTFAGALDKLGADEINARWENGRRIIREHGVTYNVYGDPRGSDRPWELDPFPLLIPAEEWRNIEEGLIQRARLFNLILQDLYGPQRLLRDGLLPPAVVFANPAFLRPCHGVDVQHGLYLHLLACDLARSPDGAWWVLADRTQAPSGSGYALENRIVLSRILPEEFRDCNVQRLARFFGVQRGALHELAGGRSENPTIVLLTPGPLNETYFEHAYLARYLGFTLVEGGDLTVRSRVVYLKTLEGLQRVDVIVRRVDDTFCDPLELRSGSFLGVPGLLDAARAGNVTVSNALGSSLMESPVFLAFLPTLCEQLLGEPLKLPGVATWWCGQAREQNYVLEHLDQVVVKPAFGHVSRLPFFGRELSREERQKLKEAITARPFSYVGQERVAFSTAPAWARNGIEPRGVVLRAFAASGPSGVGVMPGGLARISAAAGDPVVSMQSGGGSKDTWVLSSGPVDPVSLLSPSGQPMAATRTSAELPSRVADNLFWLGRYSERLEGAARLLRAVITRMADEAISENGDELGALLELLAKLERIPPKFSERIAWKELEQEIMQLVYSSTRPGAIRELVLRIRLIASSVRDRFSVDTWRILNQLQLDSRSRPGRLPLANSLGVINTLIVDLAAFSGMEMENMTRGHGWRFLDLGRRIERGRQFLELLGGALAVDPGGLRTLRPLLEICDSGMTYNRRYFARVQLRPALDLLAADATNPRSLAFQLQAVQDHLRQLPARPSPSFNLTDRMETLANNALDQLAARFAEGQPEPLLAWLAGVSSELAALSDWLTEEYFSHSVSRAS